MKFTRSRLAIVLVLGGILLLPILFRVPNPYGNQVMQEVHETSHTVLFFFAQLALMLIVHKRRPQWPLGYIMLGTALVCVFLGGVIELIQPYFHRSRSLKDLGRDIWGILAASGLYFGWQLPRRAPLLRSLAIGVSFLAFAIAFTPIVTAAHRHWVRDKAFPLLMDFDNAEMRKSIGRAEYGRIKFVPAPADWEGNNTLTAEVLMPKDTRWSGFVLYNPSPRWTGFSQMAFEVYSPLEKTIRIAVNLYSVETRNNFLRYQTFDVKPGLNRFALNLGDSEKLKAHYINRVLWYSITPERDITLYFDNIQLVK